MKTFFTIVFAIILSSSYSLTYNGNLTLTTQSQVNAFNYDVVTGTVFITGSDITNIDALTSLDTVGSVHIENTSITNVNGLANLRVITGAGTPLHSELFFISDSLLTDLSGFTNTKFIADMYLSFYQCTALQNLNGLQDLDWTSSIKVLTISGCNALTSLSGLVLPNKSPDNMINELRILNNPALTDVNQLSGFSVGILQIDNDDQLVSIDLSPATSLRIYKNVSVSGNDMLKRIKFADNASSEIYVYGNNALDSVSGMNRISTNAPFSQFVRINITSNAVLSSISLFNFTQAPIPHGVIDGITVCFDPKITNVDFLKIITTVSGNLTITGDPLLSNCCGIYSLLQNNGVANGVYIFDNPSACSSQSEIIASCPAHIRAGRDTTICAGASATLSAAGASSYSWNTGQATPVITVSPAATTDYIVTGMVDSLLLSDTVTVTVLPLPDADFIKAVNGAEVHLISQNGNTSYSWNFGDSQFSDSQNVSHTYASAGKFYITLFVMKNGCTNQKTDSVNILLTAVKQHNSFSDKIEVFPNPADNYITVKIHSDLSANFSINIISIDGTTVLHKEFKNVLMSNEMLPVYGLSSGTYLLEVQSGNDKAVYNIVKK